MKTIPVRPYLTLMVLSFALAATSVAKDGDDLEQCDQPIGTLAVVEPQDHVIQALSGYNLESPSSLLRIMVQQSNCFLVVERGVAMQNMMQERELAAAGHLQQDENVGAGQMKAADFILTPSVLFSEDDAGGIGGTVRGLLGRRNRSFGRLAGGLKFKEAETSILISDTRSGIQIAAARGKAKKTDFKLGMLRYGGGTSTSLGGYTNTNEGKVIAASFLDNYNRIVVDVRSNSDLRRLNAGDRGRIGPNVQAGAVFSAGDVLIAKIDNVKVRAQPSAGASEVSTLGAGEQVVYLGDEQDNFVYVQSAEGPGWVNIVLVDRP